MATLFTLLFLSLGAISVYADMPPYNIDCGSDASSYVDDNSMGWIGDNIFNPNGVAQTVQSSNSISQVMDTLRVFTTGKKNCYTVQGDKGGQVLVRASFNYGNYDKKSSPPTFALQLDGNEWTTVVTSNNGLVSYEAIYPIIGDYVSVCIAQTKPNQFPFISALQIHRLASNMYNKIDPNYALFLVSRVAYGADAVVRSPDDDYDRIWVPAKVGSGIVNVTSDNAIPFDITLADNPPLGVLQNAISTTTTTDNLILVSGFPSSETSMYINMYFSEPNQLNSTQTRSFKIHIDNLPDSDPVTPPYQDVVEMGGNITVSSTTTISLVATTESTLPPLINAMELFQISKELTDGTNSDDVEGLALLQTTFPVLGGSSGDPCLPASFTWDWLDCSSDATPRVTALYLDSLGLSGTFPDLSSMTGLQKIDLQNNSLTGPIPDSLGSLPNLKELNLADNTFSGAVPTSLTKNNKLKLNVTGNPDLCTSGKSCDASSYTPSSSGSFPNINASPGSGKSKNKKLPVILGTTIPSGLLASALASFYAWIRYKRKNNVAAVSHQYPTGPNVGGHKPNGSGDNAQGLMHDIEDQVASEFVDQMSQQAQQYFASQNN